MDWDGYFLFGGHGKHIEVEDLRYAMQRLRNAAALRIGQDANDEKRIETLFNENQQLKFFVMALAQLLVEKSVLTEPEIQNILNAIEPPKAVDPEPSDAASKDLSAIAEAARSARL